MSSRAKIIFMPKLGTTDYPMSNVEIVDKYSGWNYDITDYKEDGYIYTDTQTSIDTINSNYWVKFKPKIGYKFQSVHKSSSSGTSNMGEFDILADGSCIVYPWNGGTASIVNNYLVLEVIESTETNYDVIETLTNCTSNAQPSYIENSNVNITLTCLTGYMFDVSPVATMNCETMNFVVSDDKLTATLNFVITGNVKVVASAVIPPYKLTLDLEHCTCNYQDTIPSGNVTIILTCDTGFEFTGYVNYKVGYISNSSDNYSDNNTICIIKTNVYGDVDIVAHATKHVEQISSFTNLYRVTNDVLTQLSKVRFYTSDGSTMDYGSFITNLIKIPFEISDDMIADKSDIQLGNYDSNVNTDLLQTYILTVNVGSITVNEKYKNVYDYKETNCILHLPYSENMIIETEYVMNHTLTIEYKIDLYSGNCTVNVSSDFTGEIVASKTFNIAKKIPFIQEQNNSIVSSLDNFIDNGVKTAFIEVTRNIPYNVNSVFGNETVDFGTLENYIGYIKVSDILLNISGTNEDKNELETLLKNGVFINEISI